MLLPSPVVRFRRVSPHLYHVSPAPSRETGRFSEIYVKGPPPYPKHDGGSKSCHCEAAQRAWCEANRDLQSVYIYRLRLLGENQTTLLLYPSTSVHILLAAGRRQLYGWLPYCLQPAYIYCLQHHPDGDYLVGGLLQPAYIYCVQLIADEMHTYKSAFNQCTYAACSRGKIRPSRGAQPLQPVYICCLQRQKVQNAGRTRITMCTS